MEVPTATWPAKGAERNPAADPRHEPRQSSLGRSPHPRRAPQARHRCRSDLSCQVHGQEKAASITTLENVPSQSCGRDRLDRSVCCSDDLISMAVRVARAGTWSPTHPLGWRYCASDCRVDRPASQRSLRLGPGADLFGSRSRPCLWRGIYAARSRDGHSRQTDSAAIALAERVCRTTDWLDPTRLPGSRDRVRRAASASCAELIHAVLQWRPNASVAGQGLTANKIRPDRREDFPAADPGRIAPPLCPDLISDMDSYSTWISSER